MAQGLSRTRFLRSAASAVAGGAALLGACGPFQPAPEASKKAGKVSAYFITNDLQRGPKYFNETVIPRFQQQFPSIRVEPVMAPYGEIINKVNVETAAGTAPDILQTDVGVVVDRPEHGGYARLAQAEQRGLAGPDAYQGRHAQARVDAGLRVDARHDPPLHDLAQAAGCAAAGPRPRRPPLALHARQSGHVQSAARAGVGLEPGTHRVLQPRDHPLKNIKPFLDPYEKGYAQFHEVNPVWSDWFGAFGRQFTPAMRGEQPMKIAIEQAQRDVQNVLDQKLPRK